MPYPTDLQNVAIYLRKSRQDVEAESHGEGETLSKHKRALMQVAKKYRYGIKDVYEEVLSGERILERPQMQALLGAVQNKHYEAVLCMDIDRLGRGNMIDQGLIQDAFKSSGTMIITPRKVYDLRDELDEEWSEFEAFIARRELKVINRRLQRGRKQSAAEGKSISSKPPYGYMRGQDLKLYPDSETAPIVKRIFQLAAEGKGAGSIANYLTDMGIKTPTGLDIWLRSTVQFILRNPVYHGHIVWGRFRYLKEIDVKGYKRIHPDKSEWTMHEHAHEPLVEPDVYVQYLERKAKIPKVKIKVELSNPLASLVYCSKCNRAMRYQKTSGRNHIKLLCTTHRCETRGAKFELVEQRILESLRQILSGIVAEQNMQITKKTDDKSLEIAKKKLNKINSEIADTEKQSNRLHDLLEQGVYDVDKFLERNQILSSRIEILKNQLDLVHNEIESLESARDRHQHVVPLIMNVVNSYDVAPTAKLKNDLLKTIIERIIYHREPTWRKKDQFEIEIILRI